MDGQTSIHAFHTAIRSSPMYYDFIIKPPEMYEQAMTRARHHADVGEANLAKKREEGPVSHDKSRYQQRPNRPRKLKDRYEGGPRFTP